ncbi:MAG: dNTP triphosphohydrolase [Flavobacteriaceae bacterium]
MRWASLLSLKRFGDLEKRVRKEQDESRLGFEVDYDRVIFSSAFRSLQDKTQVIPLSNTDFVHTRLTHSLEVSVVGRSLGRISGQKIISKHPELYELGHRPNDFGAIVAAAALAHDIGNPPFGHSGEKAIGDFFEHGTGKDFAKYLDEAEYQDLVSFEGNANGFRLLTGNRPGVPGGLRLSYATLGAFMKYPKESIPVKPSRHIADKKYGFFQSEIAAFEDVAHELELQERHHGKKRAYARHPLTYLVEAADDICYTIIDFEDGINLGLIPEDYALEYLIRLVKDKINTKKFNGLTLMQDRLSYLRALAISTLIGEAVNIFGTHEDEILDGTFNTGLLDRSHYQAQIDDIIKLSIDKIYRSQEVLEKEMAGYKILTDILEASSTALINTKNGNSSNYDRLMLQSLPEEFRTTEGSYYELLLNASCYVASLSDGMAVHIHNKISGKLL